MPSIRDAERLQGFPQDWTNPDMCDVPFPQRRRWQLVGNALSVPVATWVGHRILNPGKYRKESEARQAVEQPWGMAGWGYKGARYDLALSDRPILNKCCPLEEFLQFPTLALSARATEGFLKRARRSSLRIEPRFLIDASHHLQRMKEAVVE